MGIKLDKDVPVPLNAGMPGNAKYPWREMKPGDSFFVPVGNGAQKGMSVNAKNAGIKVATRTVVENGVKGFRVWRIDGLDKPTE